MKALSKLEDDHKARIADVPGKDEDYVFFGDDYKMPENYILMERDTPPWQVVSDFVRAKASTRAEAREIADLVVRADAAKENYKAAQIAGFLKARDAALGENGAQRVDAVGTFFDGFFKDTPNVAKQMRYAATTLEQVQGFEKLIAAVKAGGVTSFNGAGREGGAPDQPIASNPNMTFEQKMAAARASRTA